MFRPIRTAISLSVLAIMLWAAFAIDLGGRTFAEHIDTISATPEAEQLIEGTRSKINPALQEARDRVLGEYVEAPTWIPAEAVDAMAPPRTRVPASAPERATTVPASTLEPDARFEPGLPGRRASGPARESTREQAPIHEPALPGRR